MIYIKLLFNDVEKNEEIPQVYSNDEIATDSNTDELEKEFEDLLNNKISKNTISVNHTNQTYKNTIAVDLDIDELEKELDGLINGNINKKST